MTRRVCLLLALLAMPAAALAQDRPAVFVHGFNASGADWAATAERLRQSTAIQPHLPTLDWRQPYEQQAAHLHGAFGQLPGSAVVVAHSNGGVVAREWSRIRPLDGLATIGTPHRGVSLVAAFHRWVSFNSRVPQMLNQALSAFSVTTDVTWVWALVEEAIHWTSDFSIWSVFDLASILGIETAVPVMTQMKPYSNYLADLNSPGNISREGGAIPNRVGIVSIANNWFLAGPARAAAPEYADAIAAALYGAAGALSFWSAYIQSTSDWGDPYKFEQAMALLDVAQHLVSIDPYYCRVVTRWDLAACRPNDGVVPDESQFFPHAANLIIQGPAHTQEKEQSDEVLREALVWYLHVPERSAPPPSGGSGGGSGGGGSGGGDDDVPAPGSPGTLVAGQMLRPGDSLYSPDGRIRLTFRTDGYLVLYDPSNEPIWWSRTPHQNLGYVLMQYDGNFVMYDGWDAPVWSTGTHNFPGSYLAVQNNGEFVIYSVGGEVRWWAGLGS